MGRHVNIPIFIPHEGCNNACVFCDQKSITGTTLRADRDIRIEIDNALSTIEADCDVEIAFFGGSFTGIDICLMTKLCDTAYQYVLQGNVKSIRLSTRPDYINESVLDILKARGVTDIELGIQSMSQKVLDASKRGHTVEDTIKACKLIKQFGFNLVGQMMIGLPCSTLDDELETAKAICELGADGARIYPTVVFCNTELCSMSKNGSYMPLSNEQAVIRSARVYKIFKNANISILRIGLHASDELSSKSKVYAGANHPALGEQVMSEYFYDILKSKIKDIEQLCFAADERYVICIYCHKSSISKIVGQKGKNKENFLKLLQSNSINVSDIKILGNDVYNKDKITVSAYTLKHANGYGGR